MNLPEHSSSLLNPGWISQGLACASAWSKTVYQLLFWQTAQQLLKHGNCDPLLSRQAVLHAQFTKSDPVTDVVTIEMG